ncbi:hypothetical protein ABZ892_28345 [Streptomyces sp. NPDC046924]|uniref:hypothetical protein n=1 Tax=Streptomyces sp. NPDC046924 TaxID=3155136 RepID=UPI0033FB125E
MVKSKKVAAAVGVLGGFALIGAGAVQAFGVEEPSNCIKDSEGAVRCVQVNEQKILTDKDGRLHFVNDSSQSCSGESAEVSCANSAVFPGKNS